MAATVKRSFHFFANILLLACTVPVIVLCEERLFLSVPDSIQLNPSVTSIPASQISNLILNTLGLSTPIDQIWSGIEKTQPFSHPKAALLIEIVGDSDFSLTQPHSFKSYRLIPNEGIADIHQAVSCQFSNKLFGKKYIDIGLWDQDEIPIVKDNNPELLNGITNDFDKALQKAIASSSLNSSAVDSFLSELNFLVKLSEKVAINKNIKLNIRSLYVFRISTLVSALQTDQRKAVLSVLEASLNRIQRNFDKAYNGQIVLLTEVADVGKSRKTRSLLQSGGDAPSTESLKKLYNIAKQYTPGDQATFAMILFVLIVFTLTTLAISLVMWNMDPGRDSIIYRMTSQRVKID